MDSNNILSILNFLGQAPPSTALSGQMPADVPVTYQPLPDPVAPPGYADPGPMTNILQAVAPPAQSDISSQIANMPSPSPAPTAAPAEPPRKRRSVIETIGRLADVFAKVGGAEALYEPTLNARQDRGFGIEDRQRKISADEIALATGKFALGDAQNIRLGQFARGLRAIQKGGGDVGVALPILAQRMGIDAETTQAIGQIFATNPQALEGLIAATTDPKYDQTKYGGSVVYGKDANGNLVAYQPGLGNEGGRNILPEGITPIDPLKFVDTGGAQVGVGSRSGNPIRVLPNTVSPNTAATNRTQLQIAGMPARSADGGKAGASGDVGAILKDFNIRLDGKQDPVADLIRGSTSGRAQNLASMVPGALGQATPGQVNIGRLQTIDNALVLALAGGKLGAGVSNADRDFFKEMSGKISDPNIPANQRLAAWDQIKGRLRGIQERSAKTTPVRPAGKPASGWGKATVVKQ